MHLFPGLLVETLVAPSFGRHHVIGQPQIVFRMMVVHASPFFLLQELMFDISKTLSSWKDMVVGTHHSHPNGGALDPQPFLDGFHLRYAELRQKPAMQLTRCAPQNILSDLRNHGINASPWAAPSAVKAISVAIRREKLAPVCVCTRMHLHASP